MKINFIDFGVLLLLMIFATDERCCTEATEEIVMPSSYGLTQNPNDYFGKRTGSEGDSLIVGIPLPSDSQNSQTANYKCYVQPPSPKPRAEFSTQIFKRQSNDFYITEHETKTKVTNSDYFILTAHEVWECKDSKTGHKFYRIVNELFSLKPIYEIFYVLNVEVALVRYLNNERRVRITEVKYFQEDSSGQFKAYPTPEFYKLVHDDNNEPQLPGFSNKFEVPLAQSSKDNLLDVSSSGKEVKLGEGFDWRINIPDSQGILIVRCSWFQGMTPELFKPVVHEVFGVTKKVMARLSYKIFDEWFTIVRRKVWMCDIYQDNVWIDKESYYRVEHEVVGRVAIKSAKYDKSIKAVSKINLDSGSSTVRYTEVNYFYISTGLSVQYDVRPTILSHHTFSSQLLLAPNQSPVRDVTYILRVDTVVHRTLVDNNGYDLRVGSKTFGYFGTVYNTKLQQYVRADYKCKQNIANEKRPTDFRILTNKDNHYSTLLIDDGNNIFTYISQQSWNCTNGTFSFVRVVNKLHVLVPVHEIESFDGVELTRTVLTHDTTPRGPRSVDITETKYLLPGTHTAIMFVGKITLEDQTTPTPDSSHTNWMKVISKTDDEVVSWLGQLPDIIPNVIDYVNGEWMKRPYHSLTVGESDKALEYDYQYSVTIKEVIHTFKRFIYVCNLDKNRDPGFIYSPRTKVIDRYNDEGTYKNNYEYFENVKTEVLKCTQYAEEIDRPPVPGGYIETAITVFRYITTQTLKKDKIGILKFKELDNVWNEATEDGNYVTKVRNIRVFTGDSNKLADFQGSSITETPVLPEQVWKSGTKEFSNEENPNFVRLNKIHTYQNVKVDRMHSITVSEEKRADGSLVIGSKWEQVFGGTDTIIDCVNLDDRALEGKKTKMIISQTPQTDAYNKHHRGLSSEMWKCEVIDAPHHQELLGKYILRVVNSFKLNLGNLRYLYYYDGMSISGKKLTEAKFGEVKYLDASGSKVLKYVGKTKLDGNLVPSQLPPNLSSQLCNIGDRDEVSRIIVNPEGETVEIGQKVTKPYYQSLTCRETAQKNELFTKCTVYKNESLTAGGEKVIKRHVSLCKTGDSFQQQIWSCGHFKTENGKRIYIEPITRVVNRFSLKPSQEGSQFAFIYYYDGVTVHDRGDGEIFVTEIKYLDGEELVRFVGEFTLDVDLREVEETINNGQEINYYLDHTILKFKDVAIQGFDMEIGSQWQEEIPSMQEHHVNCERLVYSKYNSALATEIHTNYIVGEDSDNVLKTRWQKMTEKDRESAVSSIQQAVWKCKRNQEFIFFRVENTAVLKANSTRIFCNEGVSCESGTNKFDIAFINEVKFVKCTDSECKNTKVLKYDGLVDFTDMPNKVLSRLFPTTSSDSELWENLEAPSQYQETNLEAIRTSPTGHVYTLVPGREMRVLHVEQIWQQILPATKVACLRDDNTPKTENQLRYVPKFWEKVGDKFYEIEENELFDIFSISQTIYYCSHSNKQRLIRVTTQLVGKVPIYYIRYSGPIHVTYYSKHFFLATANVTIDTHLDKNTGAILRYDGQTVLYERVSQTTSRRRGNVFRFGSRFSKKKN